MALLCVVLACGDSATPPTSAPARPVRFDHDATHSTHAFRGLGINLHPLEPRHLPALPELNLRYARVGAGPGWGGMRDPRFPDDPAAMRAFIAAHFDRDDPERLSDFRASFAFFREHDIRVVLVLYQIPFAWLKDDFMRTLKTKNVARVVAQWTALLEFFEQENMHVDFVELANEPDGNWDGHIPVRRYYQLVRQARKAFDRAGFEHVGLLGPGLSSLDLEARATRWIRGMPPETARALAGFSLHGWDEIHATDSMPDFLARSWKRPRAAFRALAPDKPIFLTEYATEITRFGGRQFASPRSPAFHTAAETPRYGLRVLANTLVHLNSGVSVPMLWRLADNDSDQTAWGMIRGPRRGGGRRPIYAAVRFLATRLPRDSRVIPGHAASTYGAQTAPLTATLLTQDKEAIWTAVNLDDRPRPVRVKLTGGPAYDLTGTSGEVQELSGDIAPVLSIVKISDDEFALTLPPESTVVLHMDRASP